jgi:CxxC motif-containing protein
MQLVLLALASADARTDAVPVVKSLLSWVKSTTSAEKALNEHLSGWCSGGSKLFAVLREDFGRKAFETERLVAEMKADETSVESARGLETTERNATNGQVALARAEQEEEESQEKSEMDFLVRVQEVARKAMKLVSESSDPNSAAEGGLESSQDGVVALLSDILHESDVQRAAIETEKTSLQTMYLNMSDAAQSESATIATESSKLDTELRERQRAVARLSSQLADYKRVLAAVAKASNGTAAVCAVATASKLEKDESWKVSSVLDQLEAAPVNFLQVRTRTGTSRAARLAEGLMQLAHHHTNPALEKAAQTLERKDLELSVSAPVIAPKKDDPLAEIAAFGEGDTVDATTAVAQESYKGMKDNLEKQLKHVKDQQEACEKAVNLAKEGENAVESTVKRNAAELELASMLNTERASDVQFIVSQVHKLQSTTTDLTSIKDEEATLYKLVNDYGTNAPVQIYGVATDLTAAGDKKVGSNIEDLVELVQRRATASVSRHEEYGSWTAALEATLHTLERALGLEEAHTQRRAGDTEAEKTYRASMASSAQQGETAAQDAKDTAAACNDQAADLKAQERSLKEQLEQLDSLWAHVETDSD